MKKTFTLMSVILILLLTLGAVNAADDNATSFQTANAENTFDEIQTSIDNANESDIILLEGTYCSSNTPITIDKPVTIEGAGSGAKLDGKSTSRIFIIKSDNVVLKNLILINGYSKKDYGGAIKASGNGLQISNCSFIKNTARYGGGIYSTGANVSVVNCRFEMNTAEYTGAAFELDGDNNFASACTFTSSYGGHAGGDVAWVGAKGVLEDCKFSSISDETKSPQFGGAVVWMGANGKLLKSSFDSYYALKYGSAVYWKGINGSLNYNIFADGTNTYWGNPDYANSNYWGCNIGSADEFAGKGIVCFNDTNSSPQSWVNIAHNDSYVYFASSDGNPLKEYLPNCRINSTVELINNVYHIKNAVSLTSSDVVTYCLYTGKYLKVTLTDAKGKKLAFKDVQIKIDGKTYTRTTNSQGVAALQLNMKKSGNFMAKISFKGDDDYKPASKSVKVTVKKQKTTLTVKKANKKMIQVALKNQFKKAVGKTAVKLTINKKTYSAKTNSKGITSFKVKLKTKKTYKYTVKFSGNGYYYKVSKMSSLKL